MVNEVYLRRWGLPALAAAAIVAVVLGVVSARSGTHRAITEPGAITNPSAPSPRSNSQREATATAALGQLLQSAPQLAGAVIVLNPPLGAGPGPKAYSNTLSLTQWFTAPGTVASALAQLSTLKPEGFHSHRHRQPRTATVKCSSLARQRLTNSPQRSTPSWACPPTTTAPEGPV
jgi:hypothetical protein